MFDYPRLLTFAVLGLVGLTMTLRAADAPRAPKRIALVIDDGPTPEHAAQLLTLFKQEGVKASFSHIAKNVLEYPEVTKAIIAAGHEITNHSCNHLHPAALSDAELAHEIVDAQATIKAATGYAPRWYWPPFLETDPRMPALFEQAGIQRYEPRAFASSEDWNTATSAAEIYTRATTRVTDLTVILFHEWRDDTVAQMPAIIAELKRQGCTFYTFSELAAQP